MHDPTKSVYEFTYFPSLSSKALHEEHLRYRIRNVKKAKAKVSLPVTSGEQSPNFASQGFSSLSAPSLEYHPHHIATKMAR